MAVAPASLADTIIVLDDLDDAPQPSTAASRRSSRRNVKEVSPLKAQQPTPTHITKSPFASSKKEPHVLKVENEKLFTEFVEYCTSMTQDCPEVISFLQTKHTKASPDFLTSVEFRNVLGRCLTRAQANRSKVFVYINELCTVLRQHGVKRRQTLVEAEISVTKPSISDQEDKVQAKAVEEEEQPSTSGVNEDTETDKKTVRKSKKQIAYLENLLKVYNDEIRRLQAAELSLEDLKEEDSHYIQEHKLKRKMMKIYEKLCEIKGCGTLTGRVLEQRIDYGGSRYPEINKRIEKFINSPEARTNAPDYHDILQVVLRANDRHNLSLSRKQLNEIAKEAFRETASRIQDRRHLDLVYNFGSHLTDSYKPATDPALSDPALLKKLRSNREVAIDSLNKVILKYSSKQEDTEEEERQKRSAKDRSNKEVNVDKSKQEAKVNGVEEEKEEEEMEEEEDEEEEDDQSSDPDIEEEIEASTQLDGTDGASEEDTNEAEQAVTNDEDQDEMPLSVSTNDRDDTEHSDLSPLSQQSKSLSPPDSPSQSAPSDEARPVSNGTNESPTTSTASATEIVKEDSTVDNGVATENGLASEVTEMETSSTSPAETPRTTRSQKRKREEVTLTNGKDIKKSDADITLDMGVCDSPPPKSRAETPPHVSSSQSTPPPKKNKVNVATQCDPQEVIVLSDSE